MTTDTERYYRGAVLPGFLLTFHLWPQCGLSCVQVKVLPTGQLAQASQAAAPEGSIGFSVPGPSIKAVIKNHFFRECYFPFSTI